MRLVKPSAEILYINTEALQLIEAAGRTCYKSEDKITGESAPAFADMILKRGHESVIEHASATVRFICDRGVSHEIVRHRIASYSQESTRYCDYSGRIICSKCGGSMKTQEAECECPACGGAWAESHISFIIPSWFELTPEIYANLTESNLNSIDAAELSWLYAMKSSEDSYKELREAGWRPEQARSVLPNSLKTEIVMTANLREWRHFFKLRTSAAHPQMREVAIPLLEEFKKQIPILFDDLGGAL